MSSTIKKKQTSVQLSVSTYVKIESLQKLETHTNLSRNQIIEAAVDFYYGYMTAEMSQDYLCSILGQKIDGMISSLSDRVSRLQFKEAVEINLLTRLIASHFDISKTEYDKMRKIAVDDVKATKGIINIYDAQN